MSIKYRQLSENLYEINKDKDMNVPARFYASENLLPLLEKDKALEQLRNVAMLPGILKYSLGMPDIHQGYGFPIGGVAAFDFEKGIISPGGVGYDINCGVRLLLANIDKNEAEPYLEKLNMELFKNCPSGLGIGSRIKLTESDLHKILVNGAQEVIEAGYGTKADLENIEDCGKLKDADFRTVSERAIKRGKKELGSLGSGNHFLEINYVSKIFDEKAAEIMNIKKNQIALQIHCGSRGFGHQVCSDYVSEFQSFIRKYKINLPDRELVYAPLDSKEGQNYYKAMQAAANFAFANRQVLTHFVRESFEKVFRSLKKDINLKLVYDITHNIAKIEEHYIDEKMKKVIIHRKGAIRAFGPNILQHPIYSKIGQPVLVPGSMGTSSYLLLGTEKAMLETFGSSCHGAGRVMSRNKAKKEIDSHELLKRMKKEHILVNTDNLRGLSEEAPEAYKNIDEVIKIIQNEGLGKIIAELKPLAVIKG